MGSPPSATARTDPSGVMLRNGYQSHITFAEDPDVDLWERQVTPPGSDGGDPVDTTTMFNETVHTKSPQALIEHLDGGIVAGYDPNVLDQLMDLINVETVITVTFPDGTTWAMYGFLRSVEFNELANGVLPEATCVFVITNTDPSDGTEQEPVFAEASS